MKRSYLFVILAVALAAAVAAPSAAVAFQVTGGGGTQTQNPYGLWYAGEEACAVEGCHSGIAAERSPHSDMVTDVRTFPAALVPAASSPLWPYSSTFGGLTLRPRDIYLQFGDGQGLLGYVGASGSALATNVVPADDLFVWSPMTYLLGENAGEGQWAKPTGPVSYSSYSQSCSGCHNLGVTRPSGASYTLPNGAIQTTSTPSSVSAFSIQCEVCHGSGKTPDGHKKGVPSVVGGTQMLKAQVCGQCHVSGTTVEKNLKGIAFGNANGYTTDATLSAYLTPFTTVESETVFMNYLENGGAKPKFLPNGANYSMRHSYYNEWLVNKVPSMYGGNKGHADPFNSKVQSYNNPKCLKCHSGSGFLNRIGAKSPSGKRIVATFPTIETATTSDPGISCQVCHTGHVEYAAQGAGYDSARRWADGRPVDCGDCHNWQFEMLDQPVQHETIDGVEYSRASLNSSTRHPQREMFTGGSGGEEGNGGMWGVVPQGKFMPDTECKDCHMPRTSREGMPADDDGSAEATRMSHRFHAVLPGDAARWKLRPNGDSCVTTCHTKDTAAYSRADRQVWVDETHSEVELASDSATSTLRVVANGLGLSNWTELVKVQPSSGAAAVLSPGTWAMLQHSAQNADFVIQDGSSGLHNRDYALAGLRKAVLWASSATATLDATLGTGPATGVGMTVSGTLLGVGDVAIPGAEVALEMSTDGGTAWSAVTTTAPDPATGAFDLPTGRIVGSKLYRVSFVPSEGVIYRSAVMAVNVPVTLATYLPMTAPDGWLNAPLATVNLDATPGSISCYALSGATTMPQSVYTGPITITSEGPTTLTYWSVSAQGVEAPTSVVIRLDRSAPAVLSDAVANYLDRATVRAWTTDGGSDIAAFAYSLDGSAFRAVSGSWVTVTTNRLGLHTVKLRSTDKSGKVTSRTLTFRVRTQPRIAVSPRGSSYNVARGRTITLRATLSTKSGARIARKPVYLQKSTNGRTWSHVSMRVTNTSGAVAYVVKPLSRGTVYWRWYVPVNDSYLSATGAKVRVVTR